MKAHFGGDGCERNPSQIQRLEHQVYLSWADGLSAGQRAARTRELIYGALSDQYADARHGTELELVEGSTAAHACDPRRVILQGGMEFHGYRLEEVLEMLREMTVQAQSQDAATWSPPERGTCDNCGITLGLTAQYEAEQEAARVREAMYARRVVTSESLREGAPFAYPPGVTDLDSYDAQTVLEGGTAEVDAAQARMDARRTARDE